MCQPATDLRTYAELRSAGRSRREIERLARSGDLTLIRRGVYASNLACANATKAAMHGGGLACVTAARHLGIWTLEDDSETHVWLRGHGRSKSHTACACVVHWDHADLPVATFGLPSVSRILRQILNCRGIESFFVALESVLRTGLLTPREQAWLRSKTNHAAREAIAFARSDADSGIESLLRWRLRHHELLIRSQVSIVSVGVVDFLIAERLIVEVDGKTNHEGESLRHKDLARDANAAAWGYLTLRFDYAMIVHDWATVELAILRHVELCRRLR